MFSSYSLSFPSNVQKQEHHWLWEVITVCNIFHLEQHCYLEEQLHQRWPSATSAQLSLATPMTFQVNVEVHDLENQHFWTSQLYIDFPHIACIYIHNLDSRQMHILRNNVTQLERNLSLELKNLYYQFYGIFFDMNIFNYQNIRMTNI